MFDRLSQDQRQELNIVREGHNVFITGRVERVGRTIAFYQVFFQQGRVALGKWCIGPQKGHLRTPGMDFFCTVPRPHFLDRAFIWPGYFGEHVLGLSGLYPSSLSKFVGFVSLSAKASWFLYLLLSCYPILCAVYYQLSNDWSDERF